MDTDGAIALIAVRLVARRDDGAYRQNEQNFQNQNPIRLPLQKIVNYESAFAKATARHMDTNEASPRVIG